MAGTNLTSCLTLSNNLKHSGTSKIPMHPIPQRNAAHLLWIAIRVELPQGSFVQWCLAVSLSPTGASPSIWTGQNPGTLVNIRKTFEKLQRDCSHPMTACGLFLERSKIQDSCVRLSAASSKYQNMSSQARANLNLSSRESMTWHKPTSPSPQQQIQIQLLYEPPVDQKIRISLWCCSCVCTCEAEQG